MADVNPYESPRSVASEPVSAGAAWNRWITPLRFSYSIVFVLNNALPLVLGWQLTATSGRIGMFIGMMALFGAGICVCELRPWLGWSLTVGGGVMCVAQFVPIAQMVAGLIGLAIGEALGQVHMSDGLPQKISSETGGFVVTFTTGAILMIASTCLGAVLQWMFSRGGGPVPISNSV